MAFHEVLLNTFGKGQPAIRIAAVIEPAKQKNGLR
jgi:hypothetical protein